MITIATIIEVLNGPTQWFIRVDHRLAQPPTSWNIGDHLSFISMWITTASQILVSLSFVLVEGPGPGMYELVHSYVFR